MPTSDHPGAQALKRHREQRSIQTASRVEAAMRVLNAQAEQITFASVAREAGVSRQWLYTSRYRDEIDRLRTRPATAYGSNRRPVGEASTDASLRSRLASLQRRNTVLRQEAAELRRQLERALGLIRQHHLDY